MSDSLTPDRQTKIRYFKRTVEDEQWIKDMLHRTPYGVLGTVSDDQPYVMTNLFLYDEQQNAIFMHTAPIGRTRSNVEGATKVCFSVSEMGRLLPHREPVHFDVEYASVVVFGRATMVESIEEKRRILQLVLEKYAPHLKLGQDYDPMPDADLKRTSVYRIDIDEWSGKKNEEAPEFPGAFTYSPGGAR